MGTYKFRWTHPADEVYVTGTFDNWSKSEQLEKVGDIFEKTVSLPDASQKIFYKFVADGKWITDHTAPQEKDHEGNLNNVLNPEQIATSTAPTTAVMSDTKDKEPVPTPSDFPGGFPITPASELDKPVGINPLPATDGGVNPIKLAPGEKVPQTIAGDNIHKHVKLDKESYEKSDALPGVETTLPPVSSTMIPESSLPINSGQNVHINTVTPGSTTAALAAQVPLEPKVPEVVKESQAQAKVDPEASADPTEVQEKAQVENELLKKVPEVPATSEGTSGFGTTKTEGSTTLATTAATLGGTVLAAAVAAKDTLLTKAAPVVDQATTATTTQPKEEIREEVSPEVPTEVKEAIKESGKSPEAAANTEAVEAKKEVENELLKEVKPVESESAPKTAENGANGAETVKAPETPAKAATENNGSTPASGGNGKASESSAAAVERKKKNRLSAIFGKIKSKISPKEGK